VREKKGKRKITNCIKEGEKKFKFSEEKKWTKRVIDAKLI